MKKEKNTDWIYYVFILLSTAILFRSNERMAIYMQNVWIGIVVAVVVIASVIVVLVRRRKNI